MHLPRLLLLLLLLALGLASRAQSRLSGTENYSGTSMTNEYRFQQVRWEISYRIETHGSTATLLFYSPKVTALPSSSYRYNGVNYTPGMLGLSAWPTLPQRPCNLRVRVEVSYNGRTSEATSGCHCDGTCPEGPYHFDTGNGTGLPRVVRALDMGYNDTPDDAIERLIEAKKNGRGGTPPVAGGSATPAAAVGGASADQRPDAADNVQTAVVVGSAAVSLLGDLAERASQKQAQAMRELDEQIARKDAAKRLSQREQFLQAYYQPYLPKAEAGDEQARMLLYFASQGLRATDVEPGFASKRQRWFEAALANNNPEALVARSAMLIEENQVAAGLSLLEMASALGSADAQCMLGNWYDVKPLVSTYQGVTSEIKGGNDPAKAFDYYSRAATSGNPLALFKLGQIQKYGTTNPGSGSIHRKHDFHVSYAAIVAPDEQKAFRLFTQSLQPDYHKSLYARVSRSARWYAGAGFTSASYLELAKCYEEGKAVAKDKKKAEELRQAAADYLKAHPYGDEF